MNEKVALVTGANKGIGFGIAKHLGLSGWKVIVGARNKERARDAIRYLKTSGVDVLGWVNIELKDIAGIEQAAMEVSGKYPNLSLLARREFRGHLCTYQGSIAAAHSQRRSDSQRHRSF